MSTKNVKKTVVLRALALSFSIHACFANAAEFTDNDFPSQQLGHGVYELAYDQGKTRFMPRRHLLLIKIKRPDWYSSLMQTH